MKTIILLLTTLLTICNAISQTVGLDTTFGEGGVVRTNLVEQIKADDIRESIVAVQPDGKLIIAIDFQSVHPKIIRVNQDGSLDRSLKSPVLTIMDLNAMILQDDGKIIVAGKRFSLVDNRDHFAMARLNNDGSFDIGFGKNGKVNTDEGTGGIINAVATQPDKKIVVAGNFGIARFKSDGSFDSSFGLNGKIEINLPYTGPFKEVYDIAVQQDGKIVAVGISSHDNIALARYLNNGSLDSGFSDDGMIDKDYGQNTLANAVAIQKNGKIVIAGISNESYLSDFLLVRYNVDGSPDPEFNGGDPIIKDVAGFADYARDLFIQEDGKVVTGGNCLVPIQYGNKNSEIALARYNVNGTPDSSFDRDGILIDSIPLDDENIFSLALQSDGKIIACGYARVTVDQNCLITRYNSEGSRDTSFDGDGKITPYITSLEDNATAMVIQGDGKILVSGDINNTSAALVRYMPDGNLDSGFGNNGKVYSLAAWEPSDFTTAIALQNDGKIVVAGASEYDFALWRYNADGSPDPDFGNNGKTITTLSANTDIANAIAVQKDGKILCAGYAYFNTKSFFAMVRYTSTGNIDNSFGDNGIVLTSFDSLYVSRANAMFIQDDGRIILAGKNGDNFALARYNENGTLDLSFDGDGLQTTKYGNSECHFTALALQSDGKIIASGSTGDEGRNPSDFAIARYNTDGSLDSSFGMNGLVTINFGTAYNHSYANATQPDGKILVAGTSGLATDFAFARYNTDGSPDNSFNGNGRLLLSFWENFDGSGLAEDARAIALYNDHIYIAGSAVDDYVLIRLKNNIALSLEFLEFTAAWHNDNDVLLQWVTANEVNTLSFDIEQSTDGINFALIGNVASANSPGEHQYSFVVPNTSLLSATRFYYRLKQKDRDGHFTYSKIVNLSTENQRKVMIYPNPVISEFTLTASADLPESINLRIIDNGGRILQRQQWLVSPGSNSLVINVRGLAKGIYYLQMEGKTIRKNLKFINQ